MSHRAHPPWSAVRTVGALHRPHRHVADTGDLLDGLVERLLAEVPRPDPDLVPVDGLAGLGVPEADADRDALRGIARLTISRR